MTGTGRLVVSGHAYVGTVGSIERSVQLPSSPLSVSMARAFVAEAIADWAVTVDLAAVELATSELTSNAVRYGANPIVLTVAFAAETIRVEVADAGARMPEVRPTAPLATSGRGLHIVDAVADTWGAERIPGGGKLVWFAVATT